ncbi:undecaprenyldiphospho-muramoylpentapeptide beta-N-acetylglucosaminyltransferase [Thermorudis peleae]|uniref:undecaprenyldiphospho-muramoylpentapeptide beta-N-acetylglucosaminyltransferase n=1 Tax=Thermorudis peleae TaxID=1382356 RepID=UPI00056F9274|nr:undecaprenyldiphospho-muramoylpentapeptide beta-N-acetylglucosaminyltransferase [Thermorudis peleae]
MQSRKQQLHLVIAGGGTGGHIQPAVAVLHVLRQRLSLNISVFWIGSGRGLERQIAQQEYVPFYPILTGKLRRYLAWQTPFDLVKIPLGLLQAIVLLRRLRPHVVFGTGGYVSVPAVIAAGILGIPAIIHEQTATVGLATRLTAPFVRKIALTYPQTVQWLGHFAHKATVTGLPLRPELFTGDASQALAHFQFTPQLPVLYITGGSLGAHALNLAVEQILPELLLFTQVVHQCGPTTANHDYPRLRATRAALPPALATRYQVVEYVDSHVLPHLYAAATLVVSRAGANTVAELAGLGKPAILIPLPGAAGNEQARNAAILEQAGGALVLPQQDLTPQRLLSLIQTMMNQPEQLAQMAERARNVARLDAAERLATLLLDYASASTSS